MNPNKSKLGKVVTSLVFIFFITIISGGICFGAAPIRDIVLPSGQSLDIQAPVFEFYKFNESTKIHFHVYNQSGVIATNATTRCTIHLYNKTNHIMESTLDGESNGYEFYKNLPTAVTNRKGIYSLIVDCNKSNSEFGFTEFGIEIVDFNSNNYPLIDGQIDTEVNLSNSFENKMIILLIVAIVCAIALMILGLKIENHSLIAIDGILICTIGYWIYKNGFSVYQNLITDAIGLIFALVGGYFLIMSTLKLIQDGY